MNRQRQLQIRILKELEKSGLDPSKPFEYVEGKLVQQTSKEDSVNLLIDDKVVQIEERSIVEKEIVKPEKRKPFQKKESKKEKESEPSVDS